MPKNHYMCAGLKLWVCVCRCECVSSCIQAYMLVIAVSSVHMYVCVRVCGRRRAAWLVGSTHSPINFTWAPYHQPQMPIDT